MYGNSDSPGPWELCNFDAHGKIMCETVWVAYKTTLRVIRRLGRSDRFMIDPRLVHEWFVFGSRTVQE